MEDPYERISRFYNTLVEPWLWPLKHRIVKECLERRFFRVLDVGSGTGTLQRMLREKGIQAFGLDLSPGMLRISRETWPDSALLIRGRAEGLPFPSHSFDAVVLSLMIHENPAPGRKAILEEALRVLNPEGNLFILDYNPISHLAGKLASGVEFAVEKALGGDHFRHFRSFLQEGALPALLGSFPGLKIHWQPFFLRSMVLASVSLPP